MIVKSIKETLNNIDKKFDTKFGFVKNFFKRYFPVISTLFLSLIVTVFVIRVFYSRPRIVAAIIEDDIKLITLALEKIDARCNILTIEDTHNEIDFLNTKSFSGSQVGPISLAYPKKWEGPYLRISPTLQEKFYEIVKAKDGVFVMPGRGVRLPNGLVVGKDFNVDREAEVLKLAGKGGPLSYEDKKFASKLIFKIGDWDSWHLKEETVKDINRMLKEFNEAMPFTCNDIDDVRQA